MNSNDREQRRETNLISEFLGDRAAMGGPFALLGLAHHPIDDGMILRACEGRLRKINEHRRSNTPGGDEVRMAVHAAASQLLDPALREELTRHWPAGSPDDVHEGPAAWEQESAGVLDDRLKRQAMLLLGACGGWNARSRKRLGQFARMHRLSAAQLVGGIVGPLAPGGGDGGSPGSGDRERGGVRGPSLVDPSAGSLPWVLIPAAYVAMGMALMWTGYAKLGINRGEIRDPSAVAVSTGPLDAGDEVRAPQQRTMSSRRHYSSILHELEEFGRDGVSDASAAERFSQVGERLLEQWTEFGPDELERAISAVGGVLDGVLSEELFDASARFLEDGSSEGSVLGLALRRWMTGGGDRPFGFGRISERAPDGFGAALDASYRRVAGLGSDDPEWWAWWIGQLEPRYESDPRMGEAMMLDAVYRRLVLEGDAQAMEGWERSSRMIVQRLEWGGGDQDIGRSTRAWLMGVVVDPAVRSDRLAVLTRAVALYSSAPDLDVEMMTGADDTMEQREAFMVSLRSRWVVKGTGEGDTRLAVALKIRELLKLTAGEMSRAQAIERGIELARVNSASWAIDRGADELAMLLVDDFGSPMDMHSDQRGGVDMSSSQRDEQWATGARNLDDRDALLAHLDSLGRLDSVGPKSAHGLVYLAVQAPDLDVRARAERLILDRRDEASILIALDRIVGSERMTRRMTELVLNYLGDAGGGLSSSDQTGIRRAVLGRLAGSGVFDGIGDGAREIGVYEGELIALVSTRVADGPSEGGGTDAGYEALYQSMVAQRVGDGLGVPESVHAGLMVRLGMSPGAMQRSMAYQYAVFGLLSDRVKRDHPVQSGRVDRVVQEIDQRIRGSGDLVEQMTLIERGIAELWLVVLETEGVQ